MALALLEGGKRMLATAKYSNLAPPPTKTGDWELLQPTTTTTTRDLGEPEIGGTRREGGSVGVWEGRPTAMRMCKGLEVTPTLINPSCQSTSKYKSWTTNSARYSLGNSSTPSSPSSKQGTWACQNEGLGTSGPGRGEPGGT